MIVEQKKISNSIIIILLFISFFILTIPDMFQNVDGINKVSGIISAIIFIVFLFLNILQKRLNCFIVFIIIFMFWRMYSSYVLNNEILDLINTMRILSSVLLINYTLIIRPKLTIQSLSFLFSIYIIVNFISVMLIPNGLYLTNTLTKAWFLGIENQFAFVLVPGSLIVFLSSWIKYNKVTLFPWIIITISIFSVLKIWSATGIVALFFLVFTILLSSYNKIYKVFNFVVFSITYAFIWFILIRLNHLTIFQVLIVKYLNKDLTLSSRTDIWNKVFEVIPNSIWYGFGVNSEVKPKIETTFAAHNMFLQIILDSGIIGLILLIICVTLSGIQLQKFKKSGVSVLLVVGIFGVLIGGLAESYRLNYLLILMTLAVNIKFLYEINDDRKIG